MYILLYVITLLKKILKRNCCWVKLSSSKGQLFGVILPVHMTFVSSGMTGRLRIWIPATEEWMHDTKVVTARVCYVLSGSFMSPLETAPLFLSEAWKKALSYLWFSFQITLYLLVKQRENLTLHQVSLRALFHTPLQVIIWTMWRSNHLQLSLEGQHLRPQLLQCSPVYM